MTKKNYKIVDYLIKKGLLDKEKEDIFNYGLVSFLNYLIPFLVLIVFGTYYNYSYEIYVFYLLLTSIRPNIGGFHLSSPIKCFIITFVVLAFTPTIIYRSDFNKSQLIITLIFINLYIGIFAPVDTKNKRLSSMARRKLKKRVLVIMFFWNLFIVFLFKVYMIELLRSVTLAYIYLLIILVLGQIDNLRRDKF